jgi:hypothetical protein
MTRSAPRWTSGQQHGLRSAMRTRQTNSVL